MARKGGRLLLSLLALLLILFLLYLGGVGWGLPWWLRHRLGPGWQLAGYRFLPPGTLSIHRLVAPDSSWVLQDLQVRFSPLDLALRRVQYLRIRKLELRTRPRRTGRTGPTRTLQIPAMPVLLHRVQLDTLVIRHDPWHLQVGQLAMEAQGTPQRFAYHLQLPHLELWRSGRLLARQRVDLEGVYDHGDLLSHRLEIAGAPARGLLYFSLKDQQLDVQGDSLVWAPLAGLRNFLGQVHLQGPGGTVQVARLHWGNLQGGPVRLAFLWDPPRLQILRLEAAVQLLQVEATGWWTPAEQRYDLQVKAGGVWHDLQVQGLRVRVQGQRRGGKIRWQAPLLQWQQRRFQGVAGEATWHSDGTWHLRTLSLQTPPAAARGWGTRDTLHLELELQQVALRQWDPGWPPGTLSLALRIHGSYRNPRWQGTGEMQGWRFGRQVRLSFPLEVQGNLQDTRIRVPHVEGTVGHQPVRWGQAALQVTPEGGTFTGALALLDSTEFQASGEWSRVAGLTVVLDSLVYRVPRYRTGLVFWANLQQDARERDLFLWGYDLKGGEFLVTGTQQDTLFTLEASLARLALASLPWPAPTNGRAFVHLTARGSLRAPDLRVHARWVGDTLLGLPADSAEARLSIQRRLVSLPWFRIKSGERELRASGEALMPPGFWARRDFHPLQDSLTLYLWQWPLTPLLKGPVAGLYFSQLYASGEVQTTGTLQNPRFRGNLSLESPSGVLIASSTELHDLRAELRLERDRIQVVHFEGRPAEGRVTGSGVAGLRGWNLDTVALRLHLQHFPLQPQPDVEVRVTGPLTVQGVFPRLHVDGNLTLDRGYITTPFGAHAGPTSPAPAPSPVTFRIRLRAPGHLFFINDVLQAELQADLTMEKDQPVGRYLSGELRVLQGTLTYLDRTFRVEEGRLVFAHDPDFNPELDLRAVTTVQETLLIRLQATGTLREPQVQLVSDPALPLEDLVSLLSFGFTLGQLAPSAATLAYLRSRTVNLAEALVSRELKRRLRLSELEIETGLAGRSPHFTVGFYLSPRVHIRYTHDIQSPSKDVFTLNYLLARRLWLYVDRDRDSRLGVGLNWRYRF